MNKIMIITGANGQLGSFLAQRYAQAGYPLLLLYHKREQRISQLRQLENVVSIPVDLNDAETVNSAVNIGLNQLSLPLGYLIHTASQRSADAQALHLCDPQTWKQVFETNLYGTVNIIKSCLPYMQNEQFGRIVVMGSSVTRTGLANGSAYAASKAAMVNLLRSLALENPAICMNVISPGPIDTALEEDFSGEYLEFRHKYFETYKKQSPSHSLISKEEIAVLCDSLLSDQLKNLTGEEYFITGGIQ